MPEISRIQLPNGNIYDIKDTVARSLNGSFVLAWAGGTLSTLDEISSVRALVPDGVTFKYLDQSNLEQTAVGSRRASIDDLKKIYLVNIREDNINDYYDEYIIVDKGELETNRYIWERLGSTQITGINVTTTKKYLATAQINTIESNAIQNLITLPTNDNNLQSISPFTGWNVDANETLIINSTTLNINSINTTQTTVVTGLTDTTSGQAVVTDIQTSQG